METETNPESLPCGGTRTGSSATGERELARRLVEELVEAQVDLLAWPHIVVCTEGAAGVTSYTGPFPDALAAVEAAAELEDSLSCEEPAVRCVVAPLFPG